MPPRPAFLRLSNSPREDMITAVQQHIARMSRQEAEDAFVTEIQRAVEAYYPLEWYVSYTDSVWLLVADYYEYRARVFIDPHTSQITVSGGFAPPGF